MNKRKMAVNILSYDFAKLTNPTDNLACDVLKISNSKFVFNFTILNQDTNIPIWTIDFGIKNGKKVITNIHTPYMAKKLYSNTDKLFNYGIHATHMVKGFFSSYDYKNSIMNYFYLKKQAKKQILTDELTTDRKRIAEKEEELSKLN